LTHLDLSNNQLESLPENIFQNLQQLQKLDISYNHLSSLHENIFTSLRNLKEFNLANNRLGSLPESLANLTNLEWINLAGNEALFRNLNSQNDQLQI
jgi:leucine-rich repeat transmembrane neuronal protein 1/2